MGNTEQENDSHSRCTHKWGHLGLDGLGGRQSSQHLALTVYQALFLIPYMYLIQFTQCPLSESCCPHPTDEDTEAQKLAQSHTACKGWGMLSSKPRLSALPLYLNYFLRRAKRENSCSLRVKLMWHVGCEEQTLSLRTSVAICL